MLPGGPQRAGPPREAWLLSLPETIAAPLSRCLPAGLGAERLSLLDGPSLDPEEHRVSFRPDASHKVPRTLNEPPALPCPRDDARADSPERADSDRSLLQRRRAPRTPQERSGAPPCSLPRGCCSVSASVRLCATPRTGALQAPLPTGLPGKNTEWVAMPCSRGPS